MVGSRIAAGCTLAAAMLCAVTLLSGCNVAGWLANVGGGNGTMEAASYKHLANQTCGVMVWADDGVLEDYQTLQLDAAKGLQAKLEEAAHAKVDEVANINWIPPEQVIAYMQNHSETAGEAVEEVAPRLGVSRLIYVEIQRFDTHPKDSPELWRGSIVANVEVVEVANGKGTVAYSERDLNVVAPKDCPSEGLPNLDENAVYAATVDSFTSELGKRFVPHESDADANPSPSDVEKMQQQ